MMYQHRGKMFVVTKIKYNPEKKRGDKIKACSFKAEDIVSINFDDAIIQDQIANVELTKEDIAEFKEWFTSTKKELSKAYLIERNNTAVFWINSAADYVNEEMSDEQAQKIYNEIKELKNKIRDLGHKEKRIPKSEE